MSVANVVVAKKPVAHYVDTCKGDKQQLEQSGLTPVYVTKMEYGKVPNYIQQRQKEVAKAQAEYDKYIEETMRQGALLRISNEERYETYSDNIQFSI